MQTSQRVGENHYSTQRICVKIYKGFSKINNKKTTNPIKTLVKFWNREFTKEVIKMANNHKERCLTLLVLKKCNLNPQLDTTTHILEHLN